MKKLNVKFTAAALALGSIAATHAGAQTSPLAAGGVVVSIYGKSPTVTSNIIPNSNPTGSTTTTPYIDGADTPISLVEFSPTVTAGIDNSATPVVAETLPINGTGGNVGIVGEYGSSSEGTIQVSGDGNYLTIGGYDGNTDEAGGPSQGYGPQGALGQSTDTSVPRVAGIINIATGSVDTSTVLNDVYNTNNPRSVFSSDGSSLLISGQGQNASDQGGLYATTKGTNTTTGGAAPTPIFNASSTRTVTEANLNASTGVASSANTYYSVDQDGKGIDQGGIFEYSGIPSSSQGSSNGTRITTQTALVNGSTVNLSPEGFFFANATTLYVADTGAPKAGGTGDGGIQKWSFVAPGQPWKLDYTLTYNFAQGAGLSESGFEALAGSVTNGVVNLYAVSYTGTDAAPNGLYGLQDTLSTTSAPSAGEAIVELAASAPDSDFKGVAVIPGTFAVPEPTSLWTIAGLGMAVLAFIRRRATNS